MLVLTRKQGETIRIGDDVTITVVRTKGKAVRIGIEAPKHVPVLRGEIAKALGNEAEDETVVEDDLPSDREVRSVLEAALRRTESNWEVVKARVDAVTAAPLRALVAARVK